jgi:hypothetical protein
MVTKEGGIYQFKGVAPGDYLLLARPMRSIFPPQLPNTDLKAEWHNNAKASADAQVIQIPVVSTPVISTNLTLDVGAVITGVVTDAKSGAPIAGIGVDVTPTVVLNEVTHSVFEIKTDASGVYTLPGLYAGKYTILYDPGLSGGYRTIGRIANTGIEVAIAGAETHPNTNFTISSGGDIQGALTNDKQNPLPGIVVSLIAPATGKVLKTVTSNASGAYSFDNVAPGDYQLKYDRFEPCGCYNSEFFDGDGSGDSSLVKVKAEETTAGVNAGLACNAPPAVEVPVQKLYLPRLDNSTP